MLSRHWFRCGLAAGDGPCTGQVPSLVVTDTVGGSFALGLSEVFRVRAVLGIEDQQHQRTRPKDSTKRLNSASTLWSALKARVSTALRQRGKAVLWRVNNVDRAGGEQAAWGVETVRTWHQRRHRGEQRESLRLTERASEGRTVYTQRERRDNEVIINSEGGRPCRQREKQRDRQSGRVQSPR
ncbi:hypothetical protein UFOVP274_83 [uncultured Caudovirales phage]|uniref:Uncharacterized protein n=1 Tax=uncultured Caudovirales phage TaxID=2100421 RepID=A0A6J5LL33_9CAUD|nr:hypothetical protein UFOVP274_83 [uncultured Caudovirales phage]